MDAESPASRVTPRALPWGATLLYLAGVAVLYINSTPSLVLWQLILLLALLPCIVVAVVLRVRFPYALAVVGLVAMLVGTYAVFMMGLLSLAIRRPTRPVILVCVAGGLGALAVFAVREVGSELSLDSLVVGVPLTVIVIAVAPAIVGGYIRAHRRLGASVVEQAIRAEFERELTAQRAVHIERERIAQEMHDSLGHSLALITMQAGAVEVQAKDQRTLTAVGQIRETARGGLRELRSVVNALEQDARRDPAPGFAAISGLADASRIAGAEVALTNKLADGGAQLSSALGRVAYQAVHESLTNAHRHAPGSPVEIVIFGKAGADLEVVVGNALAPGGERGAGTGLARLRSRVEILGGEVDAHASHGRFVLHVRVPWDGAS